ncbi:hypothetical protein [Halorhabdus rudnickae]|uniref:hypothetical protein n=1 Tax=Halorhabdus rudnickae TaxID=1775544 RepID=UPI001083A8CB|nr:hypothetical protein [Halorhabdus rudnickae]
MIDADISWRAAILWGLVGGFSFLVLLQGYELLTTERVNPFVKGTIAVLVTVGAAILVKFGRPYLVRRRS